MNLNPEKNDPARMGLSDFILRLATVKLATGLSRSTIYERIVQGTFPAPISLGSRSVGWVASDVDAWIKRTIENARYSG